MHRYAMTARTGTARIALAIAAMLITAALFAGCSSSRSDPALPEVKPQPALGSLAADRATVYVFNVGEGSWLGTGRGQTVTDDGGALVTVPLESYAAVVLAPGARTLGNEFDSGRVLRVELRAGQTYYLVIGLKPQPAWAKPLAVDSFIFGQTSEARARELAATYKRIEPRR